MNRLAGCGAPPIALLLIAAAAASAQQAQLVYANRCSGGCTFTQGLDDSSNDRSSVINGSIALSEYQHGGASFDEVVACLRSTFVRFDVTITDVDPAPTSHLELAIAGTPQQAGFGSGVSEVSPFSCGVTDDGIGFTFANVFADSPLEICWIAAQSAGHMLGLDNVFLCEDVMTFLVGCPLPKTFVDQTAQCGEFAPRSCNCGGTTQNTFQQLLTTVPEPGRLPLGLAAILSVAALRGRRSCLNSAGS